MADKSVSDELFLEKLNANPILRARFEALLLAVEDESGDLREADATELRLIEEMRQMGRTSLTAWAIYPSAQARLKVPTAILCNNG